MMISRRAIASLGTQHGGFSTNSLKSSQIRGLKLWPFGKKDETALTDPTQKKALDPHKFYEEEERSVEHLESKLVFPVKIVGTRKPGKYRFWAWDNSLSLLVRHKINPPLYLTFEDQNGTRLGPLRYNSELIGYGFKIEIAARLQMGDATSLKGLEFSAIPKRIEVAGGDGGGGFGGAMFTTNVAKLNIADTEHNTSIGLNPEILNKKLRIWYYGVLTPGGYGYTSIKKGFYEAEPYISSIGLPENVEKAMTVLYAIVVALGLFLTISPLLVYMGVLDLYGSSFGGGSPQLPPPSIPQR